MFEHDLLFEQEYIGGQQQQQRLYFGRKGIHEPWYEKYLPHDYQGVLLPEDISIKRNDAIAALVIQVISSLSGLCFFYIRRSIWYLLINCISLFITIIGMYGTLKLQKYQILFHAMLTLGCIGSFCLYTLIEAFFIHHEEKDPNKIDETTLILLLSIPYFIDFISGCFTFLLANEILELDEERNKQQQINKDQIQFEFPKDGYFNKDNPKCVVCYDKDRQAVLYKCGHRIMCMECAHRVKSEIGRCPVCKYQINDIIQNFD